jgi:hypothetical protein
MPVPQPEKDQAVVAPLPAEALAVHVIFVGRSVARVIQIVAVPAPSAAIVALTTATAEVSETIDGWDAEERGDVVDQRKGRSTVEPPPGTRSQWEQVERSKYV